MAPALHSDRSHSVRALTLRRLRALCCALVLLGATSGCAGFVYNRLDTLAGWYLESLVSLNSSQSSALRSWLSQTLEWHRESELAKYSQFLRELATQAAAPADRELFGRIEARFEQYWSQVIDKTAPDAVRWLQELSSEQVAELDRNLTERSRKRAREETELLTKGKWHEERARGLSKQVRRWTGAVTAEQKKLIEQATQAYEPTYDDWLASQQQWRKALGAALTGDISKEERERRILQLLREPDTYWTAEYRRKNDRNREHTFALLAKLDATLLPEQRQHLQRELTELAEKLDALTETST